ncbi:hypothetical protein [Halomonas sp. 707B3]|uniref:hypothetical protein n=1 Tax=Halomonas sp. 707B3 TaxID=1681043 RepID=UPI00209F8C15|nr:hypothetical protein [Halomonas sp. 707B3]MCP1316402.1 hypothetical protein [Halomonas sp. 707B3]
MKPTETARRHNDPETFHANECAASRLYRTRVELDHRRAEMELKKQLKEVWEL